MPSEPSTTVDHQVRFYQKAALHEVDPFARELTQRWQAGDISESDALARIFEVLVRTPLIEMSVKQYLRGHKADDDIIADLIAKLRFRLYCLMHPYAEDQRTFSLERIAAGASTRRWASNTCATIVARAVKDHRNLTTRRATNPFPLGFSAAVESTSEDDVSVIDGHVRNFVGASTSQRHFGRSIGILDSEVGGITLDQLRAAEAFESRLRALHGPRKTAGSAALARGLYGLPRALGPDDYHERTEIARLLDDDAGLAFASLTTVVRLRRGKTMQSDIDPRLLALWDDYSIDDIERLRELPQGRAISAAIASEAVYPKARPNKKRLSLVINTLRRRSDDEHWDTFVTDLVESYVATYCETTTEYTALDEDERAHLEYVASQRRQSYLPLAQEVASAYPESELGSTVDEVTNSLLELLVDDYDKEFVDLQARMALEDAA